MTVTFTITKHIDFSKTLHHLSLPAPAKQFIFGFLQLLAFLEVKSPLKKGEISDYRQGSGETIDEVDTYF